MKRGCQLPKDEESNQPDQTDGGGRTGRAPRRPRSKGAVTFVREVLKAKPYDKQVEMLRAVSRSRRVSVVGCNGSGKDWAAARVVLWWLNTRYPAKAIVTGPTSRQC